MHRRVLLVSTLVWFGLVWFWFGLVWFVGFRVVRVQLWFDGTHGKWCGLQTRLWNKMKIEGSNIAPIGMLEAHRAIERSVLLWIHGISK